VEDLPRTFGGLAATWFYAAAGSGLWLNVGKTASSRALYSTGYHEPVPNGSAVLAAHDSFQVVEAEGYTDEAALAVVMVGSARRWSELSMLTSAELASRELLRCGRYPRLRRCTPDDHAVRMQSHVSCSRSAVPFPANLFRDERVSASVMSRRDNAFVSCPVSKPRSRFQGETAFLDSLRDFCWPTNDPSALPPGSPPPVT
jgi:hypothetical protein